MTAEFQLAEGVSVTNLDGIAEGYSVTETDANYVRFCVNVSAERLEAVLLTLTALVTEPGHLIIEKGTNRDNEERLRKSDADPLHCDVFYLDNLSFACFRSIFHRYSRFFIHCGGTSFGFGSGRGMDEVFVGRYKILAIYADDPQKYIGALEQLGFSRRAELKTVWSNFTRATPGETTLVAVDGKTIHDVVEELQQEGLYLAERREQ